ncbi:hypothetical protein BC629DRAFT_1591504 [Irpex lacteus]|nr:hypothetical protein BC629DRAFT_1591504 [Irpex lacteus]
MSSTGTTGKVDLLIHNVHLCQEDGDDEKTLYDVVCADGKVVSIEKTDETRKVMEGVNVVDAKGRGLLIPGLCHAHIHLDKCFLLDRCDLKTGDFKEALAVTAEAKANFPKDVEDLLRRGRRLIEESIASGVTAMRAHVEVDETVGLTCLEAGLKLKKEMEGRCYVQIAAFAQDPLFHPSGAPNRNFILLVDASRTAGVDVIGSAPYVESDTNNAKQNIKSMFSLACERNLQLDFHLDYNLDYRQNPLIGDVLDECKYYAGSQRWTGSICVGHATRLTLWDDREWRAYKQRSAASRIPVTLIGLPQSDVYMMGRDVPSPPRSTLNVCRLDRKYDVQIAMAVNNIENAFTPQGPVDPLALCPLGVALFQAGTKADCISLLKAVTTTARRAIGIQEEWPEDFVEIPDGSSLFPHVGQRANFVLLHGNDNVQSAVCNPCYDRTTIMDGRVVCKRTTAVSFTP